MGTATDAMVAMVAMVAMEAKKEGRNVGGTEERGRNKPKSMEAVSKRRVFVDISRARDPRNSVSHQRRLSPFVAVPCPMLQVFSMVLVQPAPWICNVVIA